AGRARTSTCGSIRLRQQTRSPSGGRRTCTRSPRSTAWPPSSTRTFTPRSERREAEPKAFARRHAALHPPEDDGLNGHHRGPREQEPCPAPEGNHGDRRHEAERGEAPHPREKASEELNRHRCALLRVRECEQDSQGDGKRSEGAAQGRS